MKCLVCGTTIDLPKIRFFCDTCRGKDFFEQRLQATIKQVKKWLKEKDEAKV